MYLNLFKKAYQLLVVFMMVFPITVFILQPKWLHATFLTVFLISYAIVLLAYLLETPPSWLMKTSPYFLIFSIISTLLIFCTFHIRYISSLLFINVSYIIALITTALFCLFIIFTVRLYIRTPCPSSLDDILRTYTLHMMRYRGLKKIVFKFNIILKYGVIPFDMSTIYVEILDYLTIVFMFMFLSASVFREDIISVKGISIPHNDVIFLFVTLLSIFILEFNGYRYTIDIAFRYWLQKYEINIEDLAKRLELLINKYREGGRSIEDINLALYRFKEFKDNIKSLNLKLAYINLITALEALDLWKIVKDEYVGGYIERREREIGISCKFTVTHNALRGALVHGARKKNKYLKKGEVDEDIKFRERIFLLDPVCPIIDLLIALNSKFKDVEII